MHVVRTSIRLENQSGNVTVLQDIRMVIRRSHGVHRCVTASGDDRTGHRVERLGSVATQLYPSPFSSPRARRARAHRIT